MEPLDFNLRPSSAVPVPLFLLGLIGLVALTTLTAARPAALLVYPLGAPGILLLHLAVLGWLTPVMLGAYYQLVPVVLHAPLPAPRWGQGVAAALAAGVAAFLAGWAGAGPAWIAAGGLVAGLALYAFLTHMALCLARLRQLSLPAAAMVLALAFLAVAAFLGPAMALAVGGAVDLPGYRALLAAHASAGLAGWVLLTILGASYQLLPFFAATPPAVRPRLGWAAITAVAAGAAALATAAVPPWAAGAAVLVGLGLWCADLARLVRAGRHARREPVTWYTLAAVATLLAAAVGGEALLAGWRGAGASPAAFGFLGIVAGPSLLILGQLQKILPFLASLDFALAGKRRGRAPKTDELFPRRTAWALLPVLGIGLWGTAAGAAFASAPTVRVAAALAAVAACGYGAVQLRAVEAWRQARRMT